MWEKIFLAEKIGKKKTDCFLLRHLNLFSEDLPLLLLYHNSMIFSKHDVTKEKDLKTSSDSFLCYTNLNLESVHLLYIHTTTVTKTLFQQYGCQIFSVFHKLNVKCFFPKTNHLSCPVGIWSQGRFLGFEDIAPQDFAGFLFMLYCDNNISSCCQ